MKITRSLFIFIIFSTNVVMNYSEVEAKVREATNDDAWGPHGGMMQEIAQYTFTYEHFPEVMGMLWKRMLHDNKKNWRRVYKVSMKQLLPSPYASRTWDIGTKIKPPTQ